MTNFPDAMPAAGGASIPGGPLDPPLVDRLQSFLGSDRSHLLVLRAEDARSGSTVLAEIAHRFPNPGVVVKVPEPPGALHPPESTESGFPPTWWTLRTSDDLAPIAATAAAIRLIGTLVREAGDEPVVPALWLPPSLLEGYSLLPKAPEVVLAVDSWDALLRAYLRGREGAAGDTPTEAELEQILLRSTEDYLTVHLLVVTRRSHPVLEEGADLVLEVGEPATGGSSRPWVRVLKPTPAPGHIPGG